MIERMLDVIKSKRADTRLSQPDMKAVVRCKKQKQDALLLNISSYGVRFKTEAVYKTGEKLWFDITSNDEKPLLSVSIKGKIINDYGRSNDNLNDYGAKFYSFRFINERESIHHYVHTHVHRL